MWSQTVRTQHPSTLQTMKSWAGLEMRLGYEQAELSGFAVLERVEQ